MLLEVTAALDSLGLEYLLGGSLASSGEPCSTVAIDLALREPSVPDLVRALEPAFYVDPESARAAVAAEAASTCCTARRC